MTCDPVAANPLFGNPLESRADVERALGDTLTEDYKALGADDIGDYDLVVPVVTGGPLNAEAGRRLAAAIRAGTGLAGYHMGLATSFHDCVPFRFAAGRYWVAHPGGIVTYRVEVIMAGIESFAHTSEQYYLHYDPAIEVLAATTFSGEHHPWLEGVVMPVVYTTGHAEGRVSRPHGGRVGNSAGPNHPQARPALGGARLSALSPSAQRI